MISRSATKKSHPFFAPSYLSPITKRAGAGNSGSWERIRLAYSERTARIQECGENQLVLGV